MSDFIPKKEDFPGRHTLKHRVAPGIWIDMDDNVHFSIEELLGVFGVEDTPENREAIKLASMEFMKEWGRENGKDVGIIERDKPEDWKVIE